MVCLHCFDTVSWTAGRASVILAVVIWVEICTSYGYGTATSTISCCIKIRNGLLTCDQLMQVFLEYCKCTVLTGCIDPTSVEALCLITFDGEFHQLFYGCPTFLFGGPHEQFFKVVADRIIKINKT